MLPIPGLKESKYILDSTQAMDEKKMPENLTIIGAGYIGLGTCKYVCKIRQ